MRKKIRNVLAVAAAIITVLSINPLFSMADMPDEPMVIEWINEHGYVYYNNADEAYIAISDYLKDAWPAYEEYNGGVLLNGGIKVLYQGGPSDRIESLHDTYSSNGLFNDLKKSMLSNIVKEYGGITVNGEAYTGYYATNVFTHANEFRESLTQDEYNQGVAKAAQLADQFNYGSDYEKALRTYNYITSNIAYDWSKSTGSIYTALINNNTVCLGYAEAFFEICNTMGLEVYIVTVPQHAFNIINLDGQYYIVDSTWDSGYNEGSYGYCFKGTDDFDSADYQYHTQTYGINIAAESYNTSLLYYYTGNLSHSSVPIISDSGTSNVAITSEPKSAEMHPAENDSGSGEIVTESQVIEETSYAAETQNSTESISDKGKNNITIGTNSNGEKTVVLGAEETQTKKNPAIIFIVIGIVILIVGAGTVLFILKKKKKTNPEDAANEIFGNILMRETVRSEDDDIKDNITQKDSDAKDNK